MLLVERFEVKEYHLKLIKRLNFNGWDYCEFGAPAIDCKRPFGNSDVYGDIFDILGLDYNSEEYDSADDYLNAFPANKRYIDDIYFNELPIALQILTSNLGIELGMYERERYNVWRKV